MSTDTPALDTAFVPPGWLTSAGLFGFKPQVAAYSAGINEHPSLPAAVEVLLRDIRPPKRSPGVIGLDKERALSILHAIATDAPLPPVTVYAVPDGEFRFRLGAGYHRFYISQAIGFRAIPAAILDYWEPWMTGDPMP